MAISFSEISGDVLPAWYAQDMGVFRAHGLDTHLQLVDSTNSVAALLAGDVQVALVGGAGVLSAVSGGADLVDVATLSPVYPYLFEVSSDIQTAADLKGKRVGISQFGSSSDIASEVGLARVGLDPNTDVTLIPVGSSTARNGAMASGAIQGAVLHPPDNLALEALGTHVLFDLSALNLPDDNTGVNAQRSWMNNNRDLMQRVVDSIVDATVRIQNDKPGTLQVIQHYYTSADPATLDLMYTYHVEHILKPLPYPAPEQFQDAVNILGDKNPAIRDVDLSKMLDRSFVQSAADRGLAPPNPS